MNFLFMLAAALFSRSLSISWNESLFLCRHLPAVIVLKVVGIFKHLEEERANKFVIIYADKLNARRRIYFFNLTMCTQVIFDRSRDSTNITNVEICVSRICAQTAGWNWMKDEND